MPYTIEQLQDIREQAIEAGDKEALNIIDADIAALQNPPTGDAETTIPGLVGAAVRGASPAALGAAGGFIAGNLPGAALGAAAVPALDMLTAGANLLLGTNISSPSEAIRALLTKAGVPEPDTAAERIMQSVSEGATAAGAVRQVGKQLLTRPGGAAQKAGEFLGGTNPAALEAASGATSAGAAQATQEMGGGLTAQIAAGVAGGTLPQRAVSAADIARAPIPEQASEVIEAGERLGTRVMTSDVRPPTSIHGRAARALGEVIPLVGTGPTRVAQQQERASGLARFLSERGVEEGDYSEGVINDLLKERSSRIQSSVHAKKEVIAAHSGQAVPLSNTIRAINEKIRVLSKDQDNKEVSIVIDELKSLKERLPGKDLSSIELERSLLGEKYKAQSLEAVRKFAEKEFSALYAPINEDMGDFIRQRGGEQDFVKWKTANRDLAEDINELADAALKRSLQKGDITPEVIRKHLSNKDKSTIERIYKELTPEGRLNAQKLLLEDARQAAALGRGAGELADPDAFLTALSKKDTAIGVFFSGDDAKALNGLRKLIHATKRAQISNKVNIGKGVTMGAIGASAMANPIVSMLLSGATGGLARAYESKPVRNLLLKIDGARAGSREEAGIIKVLSNHLRRTSIGVSSTTEQEQ